MSSWFPHRVQLFQPGWKRTKYKHRRDLMVSDNMWQCQTQPTGQVGWRPTMGRQQHERCGVLLKSWLVQQLSVLAWLLRVWGQRCCFAMVEGCSRVSERPGSGAGLSDIQPEFLIGRVKRSRMQSRVPVLGLQEDTKFRGETDEMVEWRKMIQLTPILSESPEGEQ